jgi:hypothetical protein
MSAIVDFGRALSDLVKQKDIYSFFSRSAFDKAQFDQEGRIGSALTEEDVRALFEGSETWPGPLFIRGRHAFRNGLTIRRPSSFMPCCMSSDHRMSQPAWSAEAAIMASKVDKP